MPIPSIPLSFKTLSVSSVKKSIESEIVVYGYASSLLRDLEAIGYSQRLQNINQLGVFPVSGRKKRSRYYYVLTQLYLHKQVRKFLKSNMRFSYSCKVQKSALPSLIDDSKGISIGEIVQIMILVNNLGLFRNTVVGSEAMLNLASSDYAFANCLKSYLAETDIILLEEMIKRRDYHRIHLINSLVVLNKIQSDGNDSIHIQIAKELIYRYCYSSEQSDVKLSYAFSIV